VQTPVAKERFNCRESASFPGLSKPISELHLFKNGYFPVGAFNEGWEHSDSGANNWYGRFLKVMGEKPLLRSSNDDADEVYRFLWLRTFHHPVSVRIERSRSSFRIIAVELSGAGGYEPGRISRTDHHEVYEEDWCEFMSRLEAASFWSQRTTVEGDGGNDGSQWMLEGIRRNRYHVVDRWSPNEGAYREACIYLLKLSGFNPAIKGNEIY
ncbi:MAG TPA: hypothetical protein VK468_00700, partial [Pyrinomonadaceae bacterium]|nr:hypothetical protein [Pyrinomonadaceae bacterium]